LENRDNQEISDSTAPASENGQEMSRVNKSSPSFKRLRLSVLSYLRHLLGLHENTDLEGTSDWVLKSIDFRGANLWTLVFAIFIASIGLNMNSTAVIIGAMLISPLMGPIVGVGFGLGTNDFPFFRRALRNLFIAVIMSVITSALYFSISPFKEAQSEILSRTNPTAFDVFIAIFGGLAGIVAATRKEKGNAVPGVAIATALMPPLCSAGFGLATGQYKLAFGAFYLFIINSLFIAVSTMIMVRYLNFPKKTYVDKAKARRARLLIFIMVTSAVVPTVFTMLNILKDGLFHNRINTFIAREFSITETAVLMQKVSKIGVTDSTLLELTVYGKYLPQDTLVRMQNSLKDYQLDKTRLKVLQQGLDDDKVAKTAAELREEMQNLNQDLRLGILEDLYRKNDTLLKSKDERITFLENEIINMGKLRAGDSLPLLQVMDEVKTLFPSLKGFAVDKSPMVLMDDSVRIDTLPRLNLYWKPKVWLPKKEKRKLIEFLKTRLHLDSVSVQEIR
jgi:uncharacterized hydrophobic protein (TIGR00271 family)